MAWSGNHRTVAERTPAAVSLLVGGVLLLPGEVRRGSGESYRSPWVYSDRLDALLSGRALAAAGVQAPSLFPERLVLLRATRVAR